MDLDKKQENKNTESTRGYIYLTPECDIIENDNEYKILFDIPGVEKENVNLNIEKDILTLKAECMKKPVEGYQCIKNEMTFSGYKRSFELGSYVDSEKINADYKNGILSLILPKKEEEKTKEIKININ
jgi:HSP20 family protein